MKLLIAQLLIFSLVEREYQFSNLICAWSADRTKVYLNPSIIGIRKSERNTVSPTVPFLVWFESITFNDYFVVTHSLIPILKHVPNEWTILERVNISTIFDWVPSTVDPECFTFRQPLGVTNRPDTSLTVLHLDTKDVGW